MIHKRGSGAISSIPSQKLVELKEATNNQNPTKEDSKNLSQILDHRDNEISKLIECENNILEILVSMVNQLKLKLEASGETNTVKANHIILRKKRSLKSKQRQLHLQRHKNLYQLAKRLNQFQS